MKHLFATLLFLAAFAAQTSAAIWYVKPNGSDANAGNSWAAAFQNIQRAIGEGAEGDEIWVAEGTYLPTAMWAGATNRHKTFFLFYNMKLFGGFAGTETMRDQRDWNAHPTVLSGDIGVPGDISDNAYHVVWIEGRSSAMELDGFTITKGKLQFSSDVTTNAGAGIYNNADHQASTPTIRNCTITGNEGGNNGVTIGAGMINKGYFGDASATLTDCVFSNNTAPINSNGGGMSNFAFGPGGFASPTLTNCAFTNNYAASEGGAMYNRVENSGICDPVLTNCTFTGNTVTYQTGGAIYHAGQTLTLNNCDFTNNTAFISGAIEVFFGSVLATDCTFSGNTSPTKGAGALHFDGTESSTFTRCTFSNNTAGEDGGAVSISASSSDIFGVLFSGCTFSGNTARNGGAVFMSGGNANSVLNLEFVNCRFFDNSATGRGGAFCSGYNISTGYSKLYHCTFYNNTAALGGGAVGTSDYAPNQPAPSLRNCIAWNNSSTFGQTSGSQGGVLIQYSLIQESGCPTGASCGVSLYNLDPLFVNAAAHDFHLQSISPAKNAGANIFVAPIDFDGTPRPQGPAFDMGTFEVPLVCPPGPVVFVDKDATGGSNTGTSWANAYTHLQDALDAAASCPGVDEIWVAEGTYLPTALHEGGTDRHKTFFVNYDVKIFGGFAGGETMRSQRNWNTHPTILSGDLGAANDISDNAYHVVWIEGRSNAMELDGFTITKGKLKLTSDAFANAGAGIYNNAANQNSTPTIRNCTITGNEGGTNTTGAGMYNYGSYYDASPTMTDCTFSNNSVPGNSNGGGMANYAYGMGGICSPVLTNCTFTNNYAAFRGAGIYERADADGICAPVLTNCTFTGNTTTYQSGGGIYHIGQVLTLNNCTFTNNTAFIAGAVAIVTGSVLATDCTFSGNTATNNSGAVSLSGTGVTSIFTRCTFSNNGSPANGGAVSVYASSTVSFEARFERCTFSNNSAANGGAMYTSGSDNSQLYVTVVNCRFFGNIATERGGAICSDHSYLGRTTCYNCTFYNNTAPAGGGGAMGTLNVMPAQIPFPVWYNCIAWGNSSTFGQTAGGQGYMEMAFCLIQEAACPTGAFCGTGMIYNKNPLFVNAAANDFHLLSCSPAVNTASSAASPLMDFDGIARPQNGGYDIGAFEYVGAPCVLEAKCKNISVNLSAAGSLSVPASSIDNGSTGCNVQLQINNQTAQTYTCANVGSNVVTLKATDCNNLTSTCTATVTVADNLPPTITCPNSQAYTTTQCSVTANYTTPTYTDNCTTILTLMSGLPSGSAFPQGITTNLWKATDPGGNMATCAFTVTVTGGQAMTLACPANIAKNTDLNLCSAVTTYAQPTVSNPCGNVTLSLETGYASGSAFPKGTTTVTWKATSSSSAMATCSFVVTVTDAQMPSITCPANMVRSTDANLCTAVVTYSNATATDNCPNVTAMHLSGGTSGSVFQKGATTVQWKATDAAGLTKTCAFTITVNDTQLPAIACPANQTKNTDAGFCYAVVNYSPATATDNCPNVTAMHLSGGTSGSQFQKGMTTVTWKATDAAGLTKTCTFKITVNDTELPTITCPSNQSKNTDPNLCSASATYTDPTYADNCPNATLTRQSGLASGSAFPKGTNTVVYRATDAAGLTRTCSFSITVADVQAPTVTCPASITAQAPPSQCSAQVNYAAPTATDNCSVSSTLLLSGLASGSMFPQGTTTNVWRAFDNSGLSSTCAFTVTVVCGTTQETMNYERGTMNDQSTGQSSFIVPRLSLNLAPNPATTQTEVSIENLGAKGGVLSVLVAQGKLMWQDIIEPSATERLSIDLTGFPAGLYFVTLHSDKTVVTKRLVVSE